MEQKIYSATLRFKGSPLHTMALEVTRAELKLLAFLHGPDAIPPNEVKYVGLRVMKEVAFVEGVRTETPITSEMGEYKRLARKYDTLSDHDGILRGRAYVEKCFNVTLDDFEDVFAQADPVANAESAMIAAELKAEADAAAKAAEAAPPEAVKPLPTGLAGQFAKRTEHEGLRP